MHVALASSFSSTAYPTSRRLHLSSIEGPVLCTLSQLSASFVLNLALAQFVALPLSMTIATAALPLFALHLLREPESTSARENASAAALFSIVHTIGWSGPITYVHELGHFTALKLLIADSCPEIEMRPFTGGHTSFYSTGKVTALGSLLGLRASMAISVIAGPLASLVTYFFLRFVSYAVSKEHPMLAKGIGLWGLSHLTADIGYALQAIRSCDPGSDFARFARITGIAPVIPLIVMVALPIFEELFIFFRL